MHFSKSLISCFILLIMLMFLGISCQQKNNSKEESTWYPGTYEENLESMKKKTEVLVAQLEQYKIDETDSRRLTCYFSTDTEQNAQALSAELAKMEYAVDAGEYTPAKPWLINAKSNEIKMSEAVILSWVEEMCKLAFEHGCKMEGWAVSPKGK